MTPDQPSRKPPPLNYDDKKDWREAIKVLHITDKMLRRSLVNVLIRHERMYSGSLGTMRATHDRIELRPD